jgi:hypothetical protein
MAKVIRVTMPDGARYDVPVGFVAAHIAAEFAAEKGPKGTPEYDSEFELIEAETLQDNDQLLDWAANNMNWSDVADIAIQVESPPEIDYQDGWVNGEKEVVVV